MNKHSLNLFLLLLAKLIKTLIAMKHFLLLLLSLPLILVAQEKKPIPIDTIYPNSIPIIIYNNYSWQYLHKEDEDAAFNLQSCNDFDTLSCFKEFWINDKIKVIDKDIKLKDTTYIPLIDSLSPYFKMPLKRAITSGFGARWSRFHYGTDIRAKVGDSIYAAFSGKVRFTRYNKGGYGNLVILRHFNNLETLYGHLSKIFVQENQYVKVGTCIGLAGNTGRSTGPHLHFEIKYLGNAFNSTAMIDYQSFKLKSDTLMLKPSDFSYRAKFKNPIYYKIRPGDTLSRIAVKKHTSISKLCRLNHIKRTTTLRIGKIIRVR